MNTEAVGITTLVEVVALLNDLDIVKKKIDVPVDGKNKQKLAEVFLDTVDSIEMGDDELLEFLPKEVIETYQLLLSDDPPSDPRVEGGNGTDPTIRTVDKDNQKVGTTNKAASVPKKKVETLEDLIEQINAKEGPAVTIILDKMVVIGATKKELFEAANTAARAAGGKGWKTEKDIDNHIRHQERTMGRIYEQTNGIIKLVGIKK